ncbi:MAG: hypothetical protein ACOYT4_02675 [Nanoarchaeota archaeon]
MDEGGLTLAVRNILEQELFKSRINYDSIDIRFYDIKSVGVQGDGRTYHNPVEITLKKDGEIIWNQDFLEKISSRITNEIEMINRVVYTLR